MQSFLNFWFIYLLISLPTKKTDKIIFVFTLICFPFPFFFYYTFPWKKYFLSALFFLSLSLSPLLFPVFRMPLTCFHPLISLFNTSFSSGLHISLPISHSEYD